VKGNGHSLFSASATYGRIKRGEGRSGFESTVLGVLSSTDFPIGFLSVCLAWCHAPLRRSLWMSFRSIGHADAPSVLPLQWLLSAILILGGDECMPPRTLPGWNEPPMRVLIVEDNPQELRIIKRALKRCPGKPEPFHVKDGEEALEFLHRSGEYEAAPRPDLIISCLNLPKIGGHEILEKVKSDPTLQRIPFVVLTASERFEDIDRAYTSGASGFVTKSVDEKELEAAVQMIHGYWQLCWTSRD
jgi:CheY-like chemotaxis protein